MVTTTNKEVTETKTAGNETLLTPRFYTTDFKEISELDISTNKAEIEAIVEEFRIDYNRIILFVIKNFQIVGKVLMKKQETFLSNF